MTTASRSQHRSCTKTSEYPLPGSSVKNKHSYSLRARNRHRAPLLSNIFSSSFPLKHPLGLQRSLLALHPLPVTLSSSCAELAAQVPVPTACKNISTVALDPKQLCRASAQRESYRLQVPPRQQRPTSCRAWICSGCLISTS